MTQTLNTIRIRLVIAILLLVLTKVFLGLGFADQLAATEPAPITSMETSTSAR